MPRLWILSLVFCTSLVLTGCAISSSFAAPPVQTPSEIATPPAQAYPGPGSITQPTAIFPGTEPLTQPTRRPPITYVIPTPPTPQSTTARINREQAISKVLRLDSTWLDLQARGLLTPTAILTTWGGYSKNPNSPNIHPALPVWVIDIEVTPWTEKRGPEGNQIQLTFRGFEYVLDGVTGDVLVSGSRILDNGGRK